MSRELDESRQKFLWSIGDKVYLQGNARQIRSRKSWVDATNVTDTEMVNWLMEQHGQMLETDDIYPDGRDEPGRFKDKGEAVKLESGTNGMVISHFWIEITPSEEVLKEDPEAEPYYGIYCFLMVEDKMVLVPHTVCTKVA